jgi:dCTP deaminase
VILGNDEIKRAIERGEIKVDPLPEEGQFSSSALDLYLGATFQRWDRDSINRITDMGLSNVLDPSKISQFRALSAQHLVPALTDAEGCCPLDPWEFVLGVTREKVELPRESRIAARVEGRSTLARIGLMVHITAPTIHLGWSGQIALEILNVGPWPITLRPNELNICQLIFERVGESTFDGPDSQFQGQDSPVGV